MINEREFRWVDGIRPKLRVVNNLWKMVGQGDSRSGPTGFASNSRCPVFSSSFPPVWFIDTDCSKCPKILYVERAYNNSKLRGNITTKLSKISLMLFALISLIICLKKYYTRYRYNFNRNNYVITTFCILFTVHIFFLITVERMKEKYLSFNSSSTTVWLNSWWALLDRIIPRTKIVL